MIEGFWMVISSFQSWLVTTRMAAQSVLPATFYIRISDCRTARLYGYGSAFGLAHSRHHAETYQIQWVLLAPMAGTLMSLPSKVNTYMTFFRPNPCPNTSLLGHMIASERVFDVVLEHRCGALCLKAAAKTPTARAPLFSGRVRHSLCL